MKFFKFVLFSVLGLLCFSRLCKRKSGKIKMFKYLLLILFFPNWLTWSHIDVLIGRVGYVFQHHEHIGHGQPLENIVYGRLGHFLSGQDHYVQDVCYCAEYANLCDGGRKQQEPILNGLFIKPKLLRAHILPIDYHPLGYPGWINVLFIRLVRNNASDLDFQSTFLDTFPISLLSSKWHYCVSFPFIKFDLLVCKNVELNSVVKAGYFSTIHPILSQTRSVRFFSTY